MPINYIIVHKIGTRAAHCLFSIVFFSTFPSSSFSRTSSADYSYEHTFKAFFALYYWIRLTIYECRGHVITFSMDTSSQKQRYSWKLWKRVWELACLGFVFVFTYICDLQNVQSYSYVAKEVNETKSNKSLSESRGKEITNSWPELTNLEMNL